MRHAADRFTRREFCVTAAGLVAAASLAKGQDTPHPVALSPDDFAVPDWVRGVPSMAFGSASDLDDMVAAGVQVLHTNLVWPYYPLRRDGGGLSETDAKALKELVDACHRRDIRLSLGLPPFPSVPL